MQVTSASPIGSAYIYAPAVVTSVEQGTLTIVYLNVYPGDGVVTVSGPSSVGQSTLQSAEAAVSYATAMLGMNESRYNFSFVISDKNISVSGPSGGLAFTLLTISALTGRPLLHNFTVTGTIQPNGSVGLIGGIIDKVEAAKSKGLSFVIVPHAQNNSEEEMLYYISQQRFGIPIVEVANVSQAEEYAFGTLQPLPLVYNTYINYYTGALPYANISCESCNSTSFKELTNFTFNFTRSEINTLNSSFSSVKGQMLKSLDEYMEIASKGYLYASADFSFLTYVDAFAMANSGISNNEAVAIINNASNYCSSIKPPQLNSNNYEYIIAGEARQSWANITLQEARQLLNTSETSDGIVESMYSVAPAYGWCNAAQEMYKIAGSINGTPVSVQGMEIPASKLINATEVYGSNLYTSAAEYAYKNGEYAAAYYDSIYATVFANNTFINNTVAQLKSKALSNINTTVYGIWPAQFMAEAQFYINEANMPQNANLSSSYISSAYSSSLLAERLSDANRFIASMFTPITYPEILPSNVTEQLSNINSQISQIYVLLFVITALLFVIFVILLLLLLSPKKR